MVLDRREMLVLGGFGALLYAAEEIPTHQGMPYIDYHAHRRGDHRRIETSVFFSTPARKVTVYAVSDDAEAIAKLDYVQSDTLGMADKSGRSLGLWFPNFRCDNAQEFMDRYVNFQPTRRS